MPLQKTPRTALVLLLAAAAFTPLHAQSVDTNAAAKKPDVPTVLPPVVVSAPTPVVQGTALSAFATQTTTVARPQIEELAAMDIGSALRTVPGVVISRFNIAGSYGGGGGGGIFIRGQGASRPGGELVVLYDGVPRFNPVFSHPLLDLLSVDSASALHVHSGVSPSEFGNGFAAIDITPRSLDAEKKHGGEVTAAYGTNDTVVESVAGGVRNGAIDVYAGQSFRRSHGHRPNSGGELENYHIHAGYSLNKNWALTFNGDHTNNYAQDPGDARLDVNPTGTHQGDYHSRDSISVLTLANDYSATNTYAWHGHLKAYWHNGHALWDDQGSLKSGGTPAGSATDDTDMDWDNYGLRLRETARINLGKTINAEITLGADADVFTGKVNDSNYAGTPGHVFPREDFQLYSPYLALALPFGKLNDAPNNATDNTLRITPSVGVRGYFHNIFDATASPHAGIVANYKNTVVHATYARGVNYPGLLVAVFHETMMPFLASNPSRRGAWRDLDPETLDHVEVGVKHTFNTSAAGRIEIAATFFHDTVNDRYAMVFPVPGALPGFANIGNYRNHGVEASLTWKPTPSLAFYTAGTWLQTNRDDLPYAPKWSATFGTRWQLPAPLDRLRLSVDASYQDTTLNLDGYSRMAAPDAIAIAASRVHAYFLLNAKLTYELWERDRLTNNTSCELFLVGENLTDSNYQYRNGYDMPGIGVLGGVKFSF
ncbi:MAG: TonB-dependent receptor plug domain-containing protein [Puniceicoccales bacterium]|jgi:iron complex outermembrane receptor protein|nr:TonB-dependent receptor plug domain-containing protein [Puniceicoccales bacterium]